MKKCLSTGCLILSILAITVLLLGYVYQKYVYFPVDEEIVSRYVNQENPGFSQIEIFSGRGKGYYSDPRLVPVKVLMDTGETPVVCEGEAYYFRGDPGGQGFIWNTIECEGLSFLINGAHRYSSIQPHGKDWNYTPYPCFKNKVASLLFYWIKKGKVSPEEIVWDDIKNIVRDMLAGNIKVDQQIVLFDPGKNEIFDLAPQIPLDQKVKQYYITCDGVLRIYIAKLNLEMTNSPVVRDEYILQNPLSESSFLKLSPK